MKHHWNFMLKFIDFLKLPLLEGGNAIQGVSKITQHEVKEISDDLLNFICDTLYISRRDVKIVGSAGKKPNEDDLSGDIDIAVQCSPSLVKSKLKNLSKSFREMPGINVYSFEYKFNNKKVQVDLIPVTNLSFAEWSYQAHEDDLKIGLKGAHRNELMFAIAKYLGTNVLEVDDSGDPIKIKRYFYDLSNGLMIGVQSKIGKNGKKVRSFSTIEKKIFTSSPSKITTLFFGKDVTPEQVSTFRGSLNAILSPKFPLSDKREEILELARKGIKNKGLKDPKF